MRKGKIVPLFFMVILLSTFTAAQTLDEALRPLLKKGHGDLSLDYKNFGIEHFSIDVFEGAMSYFDSQVILFPRLALGLTRNLQLTIGGAYQFPITFSAPQFDEWDYWRETNTVRTLSAQLQFRPAANMELRLLFLHGRAKEDTHYPFTYGIDAHETKNSADNILVLGGTWLSEVDRESRPLRADLDGLLGPLLKKGRWRLEPEVLVRDHEYKYRDKYAVLPDYLDIDIRSTDARLRLAAGHGLTDHLQLTAEGYWQPPFWIKEKHRYLSTWWDGTEHYQESEISHRYSDYWGGRGGLAWRPNLQREIRATFSRDQLKEREATYIYSHIISQIDLHSTWISKPKRPGTPLLADLPGRYHPLLEKKQFKWESRISYRAYREIDASSEGRWDSDSWLARIQGTYGISHSLQASVYYGINLFKYWFSGFKYEKNHTLGMELKWRSKKRAEIHAALDYKPMTYLDTYPPFLLGIHEQLGGSGYSDFLSSDFGGTINIVLGCRLIL